MLRTIALAVVVVAAAAALSLMWALPVGCAAPTPPVPLTTPRRSEGGYISITRSHLRCVDLSGGQINALYLHELPRVLARRYVHVSFFEELGRDTVRTIKT